MSRYDSHKHPFHYQMNQWARKRINENNEQQAKAIPCHVTKVDKDFIWVAFENQNGIFTPPTVKIPKSNSRYSREPTQVGDKGYAVPSNYYLGGVTGDGGGNTNFYPRGNLTTLSFNGVSQTDNPDRDYDQLTHMAGPNGWIVSPYVKPPQKTQQTTTQQQTQPNVNTRLGVTSYGSARGTDAFRLNQAKLRAKLGVTPHLSLPSIPSVGGSSSSSSSSSSSNQTNFSFDKSNKCMIQSNDGNHQITCDQAGKKITLNIPIGERIYIGGNGSDGKYARIVTTAGPMSNAYGRIG